MAGAPVLLDFKFLFCSNSEMVDGTIRFRNFFAASPATDEANLAVLSRLAHVAEALAMGFQAQGMTALKAGDLDRAGTARPISAISSSASAVPLR